MRKTLLTLALLAMVALDTRADNTQRTVERVTEGVELTDDVDYVITSTDPFATAGSVNIVNTDHAVVIFKYVRPSKVISDYLSYIYINGEQAVSDGNCIVQMYDNGAIVYPYASDIKPLTCYTGEDFGGDSCDDYNLKNSGGYMQTLTAEQLNNGIRSFRLKRGYMVTFAMGEAGWGYSRCFIADQADLEVSSVPAPLNGKITSYRIFHWYNAQKKGLASDTNLSTNQLLGTSWCYEWNTGWNMLPDVECVPNHIYEDYPTSAAIGSVTWSCHMKANNEPGNSADGHPQTVAEVLENWPNLMRTGLRLCSETSHDGSWSHLKAFMDSVDARGWRCDLVDLHCYWTGFGSLTWYSDYYGNGRPIWISEWLWGASWNKNGIFGAVSDWADYSETTQNINKNGTVPILEILNSNTRVERYAYWNSEWTCSKLYSYSSGISTLGEYYAGMESGLGYNADDQVVPKIVYRAPGELESSYSKEDGTATITWTDPNGDMLDSIVVQCKKPNSSLWKKLCNVDVRDADALEGVTYTCDDSISDGGIHYYRVREYYDGGKCFVTNETNVTIPDVNSVGALQYGQLKMTGTEAITTDIVDAETAPYVVMGMISNKNTDNGITNQLMTLGKKSFKFRFYPWQLDTPADITSAESVDFLVLPADTVIRLTDDMTLISASAGKVKGDEVEVTFPEAFPEGVTPVVVAQQNSSITAYAPVTVKVYDVTNTGFKTRLVRQEGVTTSFNAQNVNYFACTPGQAAIGEGKLLTVGRDSNTPCGGSTRQTVTLTDEDGNILSLQNPYIIAGPQTHNYDVASVFRQHSTSTDSEGGLYAINVRRQVDPTTTSDATNTAKSSGDYIACRP